MASQPTLSAITVPLQVYDELMKTFDSGQQFAYSGMKDGKNRKLVRREGQIYSAEDGRIVLPWEQLLAENPDITPLTRYGQRILENGRTERVYNRNGKFMGIRNPDGSLLPKRDLCKAPM